MVESDRFRGALILPAMEALRDPFSRVHPFFWPVLWLSLRAFVRWSRRMIDAGHAFAGLRVELTWYGWIHVEAIDLSDAGKDFRRHMMGVAREEGLGALDRAAVRVEALFAVGGMDGEARYAPSTPTANTDGAYRFAPCTLRHERNRCTLSTGPPLGLAPFSAIEGGAAPSICSAQPPPRAGAGAG
ncbi:MAG: hypothetical protein AAFX86_06380 [Pseudomonadota bacterium]